MWPSRHTVEDSFRRGDLPEHTTSVAEAKCFEDQLAQIQMDALDFDLAGRNDTRIVGQPGEVKGETLGKGGGYF